MLFCYRSQTLKRHTSFLRWKRNCSFSPALIHARRQHSSTITDHDHQASSQEITPWSVTARGPNGVDYTRVTEHFKSSPVDDALLQRFRAVVSKISADEESINGPKNPPVLHPFLRRGIAFSHRDLCEILNEVEMGKSFYLYTGRGPSSKAMHVGHVIPFMLTSYLQQTFKCPLVIQLTDDEKFFFRGIEPGHSADKLIMENIKDIIAFGFDKSRTFIFRNTHYMGHLYPTVMQLQRLLTANMVKNTFGFNESDCIGKYAFAAVQAAPAYVSSFQGSGVIPTSSKNFRCLIPCAIDQDPFFTLCRGLSDRLKRPKPAVLHTKFLPALKGPQHKMSSSAPENGAIFLTDSNDEVRRKLRKAFSGGGGTLSQLKTEGPNVQVDVAYQFAHFFCNDDEKLASIREDYSSCRIHSGSMKELASDIVCELLAEYRARRAAVTDAEVAEFMEVRSIFKKTS